MQRAWSFYRSSIGKKVTMAMTGILLFGFVIVHMLGNLKIYQGPEKFNAYAGFLREVGAPALGHGQLLWIARIGLLVAVGLHVLAAVQLARLSLRARPVGYHNEQNLSFSYASRTMRWGGVIITGFVVYHLLHLTLGSVHPAFDHESAYRNVVTGFQAWPVSLAYIVCMLPLGLHMYHGLWSMTQTLALDTPRIRGWRRAASAVVSLAVVLGNISIPLAVLAGLVR